MKRRGGTGSRLLSLKSDVRSQEGKEGKGSGSGERESRRADRRKQGAYTIRREGSCNIKNGIEQSGKSNCNLKERVQKRRA